MNACVSSGGHQRTCLLSELDCHSPAPSTERRPSVVQTLFLRHDQVEYLRGLLRHRSMLPGPGLLSNDGGRSAFKFSPKPHTSRLRTNDSPAGTTSTPPAYRPSKKVVPSLVASPNAADRARMAGYRIGTSLRNSCSALFIMALVNSKAEKVHSVHSVSRPNESQMRKCLRVVSSHPLPSRVVLLTKQA